MFTDFVTLNNEYSRNIYFGSLNYFNFNILNSFLTSFTNCFNIGILNNLIYDYFFSNSQNRELKENQELFKNQYRPMRKGITNMIRLHATGAIAVPTEIKLQILASSKDVIHS
jgi:hypothetical protein